VHKIWRRKGGVYPHSWIIKKCGSLNVAKGAKLSGKEKIKKKSKPNSLVHREEREEGKKSSAPHPKNDYFPIN